MKQMVYSSAFMTVVVGLHNAHSIHCSNKSCKFCV